MSETWTEVELAAAVIAWLRDQQWTIYQEVAWGRGSNRADIVAEQNGILWVVEVKRSLSLSLLSQAWDWTAFAHYVSIACPRGKKESFRGHRASFLFCHDYGIGRIELSHDAPSEPIIAREAYAPRIHRKILPYLKDALCEQHQTYAEAGNATSSFYSPFKETCRRVLDYVKDHPGAPVKEIVDNIKHHYPSSATARSCLRTWMCEGKVPGIESRVEGRRIRFYPKHEAVTLCPAVLCDLSELSV